MGPMRNGKVHGVLTGLRLASHENVVLADDDVRYSVELLSELVAELEFADVVRPQNFFAPLPWTRESTPLGPQSTERPGVIGPGLSPCVGPRWRDGRLRR